MRCWRLHTPRRAARSLLHLWLRQLRVRPRARRVLLLVVEQQQQLLLLLLALPRHLRVIQ